MGEGGEGPILTFPSRLGKGLGGSRGLGKGLDSGLRRNDGGEGAGRRLPLVRRGCTLTYGWEVVSGEGRRGARGNGWLEERGDS